MRFIVPAAEFDFSKSITIDSINSNSTIDSSTSVNQQKEHFFETLSKIGTVIKFENNDEEQIKELCIMEDVAFATFHESPPDNLACRLLNHSKGGLMVTGGFLNRWTFMGSTMNVVTSQIQANQIFKSLSNSAPLTSVFVPRMNTDIFRLPSKQDKEKAREIFKIKKHCFHIVYAGRLISNKGIAQLLRAITFLDDSDIRITIVGDFELDFFIYQGNATNATFNNYFQREIVERHQHLDLVCLPSMAHRELCNLFWSADCFIYPSFHEDEALGTTPREAILCGVPTVVTDFCGLGALRNTIGGVVKTYPTLGGVRYSLKELSAEIHKIYNWKEDEKKQAANFNNEWVRYECNTQQSTTDLKTAAENLLKTPVTEAPIGGWRSKERLDKWIVNAPYPFKEAMCLASSTVPEGLFVDGTGFPINGWFSEPHFLQAIQGIYTTFPASPKAAKGKMYRGFWRIVIWEQENAIVEFGFPGPRVKRYSSADLQSLITDIKMTEAKEPLFLPQSAKSLSMVQELIDLGYVVPDEF